MYFKLIWYQIYKLNFFKSLVNFREITLFTPYTHLETGESESSPRVGE